MPLLLGGLHALCQDTTYRAEQVAKVLAVVAHVVLVPVLDTCDSTCMYVCMYVNSRSAHEDLKHGFTYRLP
jgi:hypothetical protein